MKNLILLLLLSSILFACEKTLTEPEPEPELEVTDPQNSISYLLSENLPHINSIPKYTVIKLKFGYHINDNEISSKGFRVSQVVSTDLNDQYQRVSHRFELTLRTDTIEYLTNLWEYASPGDTAFFIVNLQRRLSEDTYSNLAADTLILKVTE